MHIPLLQIDAFTTRVLRGNPAAVMPFEAWPEDELLLGLAAENALSETAFLVPAVGERLLAPGSPADYELRWFTPAVEVDLCGHATLAAAHALMVEELCGPCTGSRLVFASRSGLLTVEREGEELVLDFPARPGEPAPEEGAALGRALGVEPVEVQRSRDLLAVLPDEASLRALEPDMAALARLDSLGVIATAPAEDTQLDFVSRFFAPGAGVPEDPVTGSAHCTLTPYWASRLDRQELLARQISARGGELRCTLEGDRVRIAGRAVTYLRGTAEVPAADL